MRLSLDRLQPNDQLAAEPTTSRGSADLRENPTGLSHRRPAVPSLGLNIGGLKASSSPGEPGTSRGSESPKARTGGADAGPSQQPSAGALRGDTVSFEAPSASRAQQQQQQGGPGAGQRLVPKLTLARAPSEPPLPSAGAREHSALPTRRLAPPKPLCAQLSRSLVRPTCRPALHTTSSQHSSAGPNRALLSAFSPHRSPLS